MGQGQVLDRVGQAVHPAAIFATGQFGVALLGLGQQGFGRLQADQGIDQGVVVLDVGKVGLHHFPAGNLTQADTLGEFMGLEQDQFAGGLGDHGRRAFQTALETPRHPDRGGKSTLLSASGWSTGGRQGGLRLRRRSG